MNGIEMILRKALLDIKVNSETLFQAIEQGFGKRNDNMFVHQSSENLSDLVEDILPEDLNLFDSLGFELNSDMIVMNEDVVSQFVKESYRNYC